MKSPDEFETPNLDLGSYLMLEGIEYLGCRIIIDQRREEPKAVLKFKDEKKNCRDLERAFIRSRERSFSEYKRILLKEIHREIRDFDKKLKDLKVGD